MPLSCTGIFNIFLSVIPVLTTWGMIRSTSWAVGPIFVFPCDQLYQVSRKQYGTNGRECHICIALEMDQWSKAGPQFDQRAQVLHCVVSIAYSNSHSSFQLSRHCMGPLWTCHPQLYLLSLFHQVYLFSFFASELLILFSYFLMIAFI